ncbi:MAG: VWA domain-containing protein [Phycisphaerales bacterium]|jgi:Mg-chelatase subunit ChlD|nr:VWA domain-containing protein [Phycisphaerales bacterium]MBT7171642.1 VWA domain-containing protein [Phycisphaerales bacterium]
MKSKLALLLIGILVCSAVPVSAKAKKKPKKKPTRSKKMPTKVQQAQPKVVGGFFASETSSFSLCYLFDFSAPTKTFPTVTQEVLLDITRRSSQDRIHFISADSLIPKEPMFQNALPVLATAENKRTAEAFVKTLKPYETTDPVAAFYRAYEVLNNSKQPGRVVYYLTDGNSANPTKLLAEIKKLKAAQPEGKNIYVNVILYSKAPTPAALANCKKITTLTSGRFKHCKVDPAAKPSPLPAKPKCSFLGVGTNDDNVLYLIDRSGSMLDTFDEVKLEMILSISQMSSTQKLHTILFKGDKPQEPKLKTIPAELTDENKLVIAKFLNNVVPIGRTDPIPAIMRAYEIASAKETTGKTTTIYLLTDGLFPDNTTLVQTIKTLQAALPAGKTVKINTILYSNKPAEAVKVMEEIATLTGGEYKFVPQEDN